MTLDGTVFCQILPHFAAREPGAVVLMDNVAYHKFRETREKLVEHEMYVVFNVAYSPGLNGIKRFFSMVKRTYKQLKLNCIQTELLINI